MTEEEKSALLTTLMLIFYSSFGSHSPFVIRLPRRSPAKAGHSSFQS
jgi:hypothetical protein